MAVFGKVASGYEHYFSTFWKCPTRDHTNWNTLPILQENPNPNPNPIPSKRKDLEELEGQQDLRKKKETSTAGVHKMRLPRRHSLYHYL